MSVNNSFINSVPSLVQPLATLFPAPIVAKRAPTVNDINYPIGQEWVYPLTNAVYFLASVAAGVATWVDVTAAGGAGVFASLAVTPGPTAITGTTGINTAGAGVTTIGTGGTGAVNIGNATGNTAITGTLTTSAGITATTGNIVASAGNLNATIGSVGAATTVTAGTGITATTGNIQATNGNVVLGTAGNLIMLPGGVTISTGAGAPAVGLAVAIGCVYINTTAASAVTRMYIATAVGAWTNVTCAA